MSRPAQTYHETWMVPRLLACHRVLKATGSLYLHCDPSASHYRRVAGKASFSRAPPGPRAWLGIDLSEHALAIAAEWLAKATAQPELFETRDA